MVFCIHGLLLLGNLQPEETQELKRSSSNLLQLCALDFMFGSDGCKVLQYSRCVFLHRLDVFCGICDEVHFQTFLNPIQISLRLLKPRLKIVSMFNTA